jgi:hypothetical protein
VSQIKRLLSRNIYSKRESWSTALSLTEQGQKAAPENNATRKKELLSLFPGNIAEGSDGVGDDDVFWGSEG